MGLTSALGRKPLTMRWAACLASLLTIAVGSAAPNLTPVPDPPVRIDLSDPEDRGTLNVGDQATRSVKVENTSGKPIEIRVIAKSCTCLNVKHPERLAPGEAGTISFGTPVVEAAGAQRHGIRFAAVTAGEDGLAGSSYEFLVPLSYTPNVEVICTAVPETAVAVAGTVKELSIYVRRVDGKAPELTGVTTPPWITGKKFRVLPDASGVGVLALSAESQSPGLVEGVVTITPPAAEPQRLMLRVRFVSPACFEPAGVAVLPSDTGVLVRRSTVAAREGVTLPGDWTVRVRADGLPMGVVSASRHGVDVVVRLDTDGVRRVKANGTAGVDIVSVDGKVLGSLPVVWLAASAPAPR